MHPTKNPIVHSKHFNVIISEHFSSQSRNLSDRFLFVKSEYKLKWNFREKIRSISQKNRSPLHFWNIFVHSKKERLMNDKNPPLLLWREALCLYKPRSTLVEGDEQP